MNGRQEVDAIEFIDGIVVYHNKLASNMINAMTLNTKKKNSTELSLCHP